MTSHEVTDIDKRSPRSADVTAEPMSDDRREFIAARVRQLYGRGLFDESECLELCMGILYYEKAYMRLWRKYTILTLVLATWTFGHLVWALVQR